MREGRAARNEEDPIEDKGIIEEMRELYFVGGGGLREEEVGGGWRKATAHGTECTR